MRDLHVHTTFCDGKDSPEEMVVAAIEKGLKVLGFSVHSYTFFDETYCIKKENIEVYKKEISRLKEKYQDKIAVLCGVEQDVYSTESTHGFDYVIGSVHYAKTPKGYFAVDDNEEAFVKLVKDHFYGDYYALAENYFSAVAGLSEKTKVDIVGHFDLVSKFNEGGKYFDENHPRYVKAYRTAVDKLIPRGIPFEINTGAISRGYKTTPYPSLDMLKYICEKGGKVTLSGDTHAKENLCFQFEKWEKAARDIGLKIV